MATKLDRPAPPELRAQLSALIAEIGQPLTRARLGISRQALDRVLSGQSVRNGTLMLCFFGLAEDGLPLPTSPHASDLTSERKDAAQ